MPEEEQAEALRRSARALAALEQRARARARVPVEAWQRPPGQGQAVE